MVSRICISRRTSDRTGFTSTEATTGSRTSPTAQAARAPPDGPIDFGLDHTGYSTQAAFFDYDSDGDLDMYLLNYSVHSERGASARPQREVRHPKAGDRLFNNDGNRF